MSRAFSPVGDPRAWARICRLFELAVGLTPNEREHLLSRCCRDAELRALLRRMLDADRRATELDVMCEAMVAHRARLLDSQEVEK